MESFNSDFVMVVNGQRISAFVSDCLCGIKATTINALKRVGLCMMKGGENVEDNQRKGISIRNIKLSEGTSRNRYIHSRIDVRAMSVKGKLDRMKMSHTIFDYEYRKRILHSILNYLQTKNSGAYAGYADMDNVISSETK